MKRGTIDHPKMAMLEAELGVPKYVAVGILESLWHWAARYAIQGDIGRWPDAAIARGIGWDQDPEKLIQALEKSRWIDRVDGPARLVIHDIKDHADNAWKQNLEDARLKWWDESRARFVGQGKRPATKHLKNKKKSTSRRLPDDFQTTSSQPPQPVSIIQYPEPEKEKQKALSGSPPDVDRVERNLKQEAREVLAYLNQQTGHDYREVDANLDLISARLKSGATVDDCKKIVVAKARDWKGNPETAIYLRPETLFGKTKFESYLGQVRKKPVSTAPPTRPAILDVPEPTPEERQRSIAAAKKASQELAARWGGL